MRRTSTHPLLRIAFKGLMLLAFALAMVGAGAQGVEFSSLRAERVEGALTLEYSARLTLTHAIEDALQRGLPMYFVAQATVWRNRWYWRDERIARVSRSWRLSYQPLTATWRVSLGGLSQSFATLAEAIGPMSHVAGWGLVEADKLDPGERYYVDFSLQLDNSQLPRPMQIDLGQDWKLGSERTVRVE